MRGRRSLSRRHRPDAGTAERHRAQLHLRTGSQGVISSTCTAHLAVLNQRFLDGLLFARWMRERLISEELRTTSSKAA